MSEAGDFIIKILIQFSYEGVGTKHQCCSSLVRKILGFIMSQRMVHQRDGSRRSKAAWAARDQKKREKPHNCLLGLSSYTSITAPLKRLVASSLSH